MEDNNITKYIPLAVSCIALVFGLSNRKAINTLDAKNTHNIKIISDTFNQMNEFEDQTLNNFKIIAKDLNRIASSVGFKGKLGINE